LRISDESGWAVWSLPGALAAAAPATSNALERTNRRLSIGLSIEKSPWNGAGMFFRAPAFSSGPRRQFSAIGQTVVKPLVHKIGASLARQLVVQSLFG